MRLTPLARQVYSIGPHSTVNFQRLQQTNSPRSPRLSDDLPAEFAVYPAAGSQIEIRSDGFLRSLQKDDSPLTTVNQVAGVDVQRYRGRETR